MRQCTAGAVNAPLTPPQHFLPAPAKGGLLQTNTFGKHPHFCLRDFSEVIPLGSALSQWWMESEGNSALLYVALQGPLGGPVFINPHGDLLDDKRILTVCILFRVLFPHLLQFYLFFQFFSESPPKSCILSSAGYCLRGGKVGCWRVGLGKESYSLYIWSPDINTVHAGYTVYLWY